MCDWFAQITEKVYQKLEPRTKTLRFSVPFPLLAFPVYLVRISSCYSAGRLYRSASVCILNLNLNWISLDYWMFQWYRSPGKEGSHFNPSSDLFTPKERRDVIISTTCWFTMIALLIGMACVFGLVPVLKLYGVPYIVSNHTESTTLNCLVGRTCF